MEEITSGNKKKEDIDPALEDVQDLINYDLGKTVFYISVTSNSVQILLLKKGQLDQVIIEYF